MSSLGALASLVRTLHAERGVLARPELELAAGIDPNAPKTWRKINPSGDPAAAQLVVGAHLMAALPSSAILRFTMTACIAVSSVDSLIVGVRCSSVDSRTMQCGAILAIWSHWSRNRRVGAASVSAWARPDMDRLSEDRQPKTSDETANSSSYRSRCRRGVNLFVSLTSAFGVRHSQLRW